MVVWGTGRAQLGRAARIAVVLALAVTLAGCGGGLFGGKNRAGTANYQGGATPLEPIGNPQRESTIWDIFGKNDDPNTTVEVNKYLWQASQEILNFLPIQSVDPFSGILVYGYGTPPGGGASYRATVFVQDPSLDARALKVALVGRGGGPVDADTQRAVEDAILTRARQLRIRDTRL